MATNTQEIHTLTTAEIARQVAIHTARRRQIVNERAAMFANALKNGGSTESPVVDSDERAAREHAKALLNGAAPPSLSLPPEITRDKALFREQRGIDIALRILADESLAARAADAVAWSETHSDQWGALCREIALAAIRLQALENRARELIGQCPDIFAVRLPMTNLIGGRTVAEIPVSDLTDAAISEGVITLAEIRKAQTC
jgi:hypothetical protein